MYGKIVTTQRALGIEENEGNECNGLEYREMIKEKNKKE
jgi:hypothetical protein